MKYVIVKRYEDELVKLTKPATATQARNSLERFKGIGITDIEILPANKVKKALLEEESSDEFLKAKKDFEEINE
tara:strand:- start:343 stop:564 length:222 start_codon:yes stop_codon:yes gene_type:complete